MPSKPFLVKEKSRGKQALFLLWRSARPEKNHLLLGLFWLILAAGSEMLGPLLGKALIDEHLLTHQLDVPRMVVLLLSFLLTGWFASLLRYFQLVRLSQVAMRSVCRLREEVYHHVLHLPMTFFDKAITGQLVSRVTNDTEAVKSLYIQVLFVILNSSIILAGAIIGMAWLDWQLMLYVLILFPAVSAIVWWYQHWSGPAVINTRQLCSDINAQVAESIGGMAVLQACNATTRYIQQFTKINKDHYKARLSELRANAWLLRPAIDMLNILLLILVIFNFSQRPLNALEAGLLYAFINYIARVIEPLIQITMQSAQLQQSVVAAARINSLLQQPRTKPQKNDVMIEKGAVSIQNLSFGYSDKNPVLHDLSLEIPAGAFYGIVGHTGSGKSTLLSLMLRFYQASQGHINIDGVLLENLDDQAFRAQVGLVPQDPFLLVASVRENIAMGRNITQTDIETAANAARAHDFILALESGYDTPLGEGGSPLSAGQKQLIAIARALVVQPHILFLDEATSHIDSDTEQRVQSALKALHGKVTLIAIAHRLSTIRDADKIVVLNHGYIAESGTHADLMLRGGIYQRLYLLQQLGE